LISKIWQNFHKKKGNKLVEFNPEKYTEKIPNFFGQEMTKFVKKKTFQGIDK
jgi:hypothetical protein